MAEPIMRLETENPGWKLEFSQLRAREKLGRLFEYEVTALSPLPDIELKDMLGTKVSVVLTCNDESKRYFTGWAVRAGQTGVRGRLHEYTLHLRPWLWFATRQRNNRIFQNLKVPDILAKVFEHGVYQKRAHDIDFTSLTNPHIEREYCVQFRESDFDFVSRLMEEEGIYYWFDTIDSQVAFNIADNPGAHSPSPGTAKLPFQEHSGRALGFEHVWDWKPFVKVPTQMVVQRDHFFEKPRDELEVTEVGISTGLKDLETLEFYDYPDEYVEKEQGSLRAQAIADSEHSRWHRVSARTNARNLRLGTQLEITDHPRKDQNGKYLIVEAEYELDFSGTESQTETLERPTRYECRFTAIKANVPYASERTTPRPVAPGPQTAVVTGPSGEEIHTDEYGRVKVQFFWDREGKHDENTTCWLRVSQPWAGDGWGAMFVPRIGNEVIVDFIGGNLDRPIVTGRVYNPDQMPPWTLPGNKTKTGIRTRSSKGGSDRNYNELVFEDKKGEELVGIHAEKNMSTVVEHNDSTSVGNDQSVSVGHDRSVSVANDQTTTILNNRSITVAVNDQETVGSNQTIAVGASQSLTVGGPQSITVSGKQDSTYGNEQTITVAAKQAVAVGADQKISVYANQDTVVGGDQTISAAGNQATTAGKKVNVTAGTDMTLQAASKRADISGSEHKILTTNLSMTAVGITMMAAGNIDATSMGGNTTVIGSNSDGYIGSASSANLGMNRETFLGLNMSNAFGMEISNCLAMQVENVAAMKIENTAALVLNQKPMELDLSTLKIIASGGPGAAAAAVSAISTGIGFALGLGVAVLGVLDVLATIDQYNEALANIQKAKAEAEANGLTNLAQKLGELGDAAADKSF